ncbi:hypothetical protein ACFXB3_01480 [Streptomyces sp. NPDC059447]
MCREVATPATVGSGTGNAAVPVPGVTALAAGGRGPRQGLKTGP